MLPNTLRISITAIRIRFMSAGICVIDRRIIHISIPIIPLHPWRHNGVCAGEPAQLRVVETRMILHQPEIGRGRTLTGESIFVQWIGGGGVQAGIAPRVPHFPPGLVASLEYL